jgi:hypothetical protein
MKHLAFFGNYNDLDFGLDLLIICKFRWFKIRRFNPPMV